MSRPAALLVKKDRGMTSGSFRSLRYRRSLTLLAAGILIATVTLYLALPIIALFLRISPDLFFTTLRDPQVQSALWLSLFTTTITLAVVLIVGTPFAYFHSRYTYPGKIIVDTLIDLPLVLPPAVAGVASWLWFPYMLAFPVNLLTGAVHGHDVWGGFRGQLIWIAVWLFLCRTAWKQGIKRYGAAGG